MPNILVDIPAGAFSGAARTALVRHINNAAADAECLPAGPHQRMLCWVLIKEARRGAWTCGGSDITAKLLPCLARVYLPAGVLDDTSRALYVQALHTAFEQAKPTDDPRQIVSSVTLHDVPDGTWGVNGVLWKLPQFAKAAGFTHLQHLAVGDGLHAPQR
jgi:phenylpyruvate tautomerase PptA (4-oxalocrotonate tautomerase family)